MAGLAETRSPLIKATTIGTILQLAMVVAGHFMPAVAARFPIGGSLISAIAGLLFARSAPGIGTGAAVGGGAIAGGASAFLGILASTLMGDMSQTSVLATGTAASGVAGVIGGVLGQFLGKKAPTT